MATDSISPEDIAEAFARIEDELLASMMRNMAAHRVEELDSGAEWAQWQAVQLQGLHDYARRNNLDHGPAFDDLNGRMEEAIAEAYERGYAAQEAGILEAMAKGWEPPQADMLRPSPHRLDALLRATHDDMMRAEHATLRRAEDIYRKTIFSAQLYATSGAGTYEKAIDMAVVDFLKKGVDGIVYKNGSRHTIREYSQMAVRTAAKRAAMAADGDARRDWGVHTIFVNYRADACPECMEWVGQVLVDDVYSGGTPEEAAEGGYALLSDAMAQGLFHPNCRDTQSTYFEGINEPPKPFTPEEMGRAEEGEAEEQARSQAEQSAREWGRAAEMLLDPADKAEAQAKAEEWAGKAERRKRGQIDNPHYDPFMREESLAEFNEWAMRSIMDETGYSEDEARRMHAALIEYFGGDTDAFGRGEKAEEVATINAGLERMAVYDGRIYRGMTFGDWNGGDWDRLTALQEGEAFPAFKSIQSFTTDLDVARDFADTMSERTDSVLLVVEDNRAGVGVQHISKFGDVEAEVLVPSTTAYTVEGVDMYTKTEFYRDVLGQETAVIHPHNGVEHRVAVIRLREG